MQMTIAAAATALMALPAWGQEAAFFRRERIDFWGDAKSAPPPSAAQPSIWAEPVQSPDGRTAIRVPPPPVLAFLENPTRETGAKYLAWQEERMRKLKAAIEVLKDLQASKAGRPSGELLYFKKDGCPACREQDEVLARLTRDHPGIKVRPLLPREAPDLWKAYGVSAVPTLVAKGANGKAAVLRGLAPQERLLAAFQEVSHDGP